jgi:hypothetical protein
VPGSQSEEDPPGPGRLTDERIESDSGHLIDREQSARPRGSTETVS